jgi:hypothetical protein
MNTTMRATKSDVNALILRDLHKQLYHLCRVQRNWLTDMDVSKDRCSTQEALRLLMKLRCDVFMKEVEFVENYASEAEQAEYNRREEQL